MARWLTMALKDVVDWPDMDFHHQYDGYDFLLLAETENTPPAIALELTNKLDSNGAIAAIRRFLSAFAWVTDHPIQDHFAIGAKRPGGVGKDKGPVRTANARFRLDYLPSTQNPKARLSLALYREALGLNNEPYQFLGFFKIINVLHERGPAQEKWINATLPKLTDHQATERLKELAQKHANLGKYLYESGRCAVAHAYNQPVVDPDNPKDTWRLGADLPVIHALACYLIEHDFGIKSSDTVRQEHLYRIEGFRDLLGTSLVSRLKRKGKVEIRELPAIPEITIYVRDHMPYLMLSGLIGSAAAIEDGCVILDCTTKCGLFGARFVLDFPNESLGFDVLNGMDMADDGSAHAMLVALDQHRLFSDLFRNGVLELVNTQSLLVIGRTDPFVPVNMRYNHEAFEAKRLSLQNEYLLRLGHSSA